jgi:hypothetical protein
MVDTKRLRLLLRAATPGPWISKRAGTRNEIWAERGQIADLWLFGRGPVADFDADIIAEAINALPELLDELDALRAATIPPNA